MTVYQVLEWDKHFENFKSRTVDRCSYVCTPNKQHGEGLMNLLAMSDGLAMYGVFNLILGACSQHSKPRQGWLTNDGTPQGKPWTAKLLSIRWRQKESIVEKSLQVLCSAEVGWLVAREVSDDGYHADTTEPLNGREGKGREGNAQPTAACTEPDEPASVPANAVLVFPVVGRDQKAWGLTQGRIDELSTAFPGLDVVAEGRKALLWVNANPGRRKTARGMPRFLFGWMERTQNRRGGAAGSQSTPSVPINDSDQVLELVKKARSANGRY